MGAMLNSRVHSHEPPALKLEDAQAKAAQKRGRRTSVSAECIDVKSDASEVYEKKVIPKSSVAYDRIRRAVEGNIMFQSLDESQKFAIFDAMEEKQVPEGTVVIQEGDQGDYFYVVDSGEFDVFVGLAPSKEEKKGLAPIFHYAAGGSFGELALMYNAPRAATVVCVNPGGGVLWALDRASFRHIIVKTNTSKSKTYEGLLNTITLLNCLSAKEKSSIVDALIECEFPSGHVVIQQGDTDRNAFLFYILVEGRCLFEYADKKRNVKAIVGHAKAGEYFGEKALLDAKEPRAVSVIADGPIKCLSMDRATFERLMGPIQNIFQERIHGYSDVQQALNAQSKLDDTTKSDMQVNMNTTEELVVVEELDK